MKVCIVGAGVIGLTSAFYLAKQGHDVTIVDSGSRSGLGASYANGGQLSYSYVAPLADASVWKNLPKFLFSPDSPLEWRPQFGTAQWQWIARFMLACRSSASQLATMELLRLAFFSRDCLGSMQSQLGLHFSLRTSGKLVMFDTTAGLQNAARQVELQRQWGCEQQVLSIAECVAVEPAIAGAASNWIGGVYTPSEQSGDCAEFCSGLKATLDGMTNVRFAFDTIITGAVVESGRLKSLRAKQQDLEFDSFVIAAGAGSAKLARTIGLSIPVYPLKGYSITSCGASADGLPSVSITDYPKKVVYARLGNRLRVAGRVEIVGNDMSIDLEKIRALKDAANALFPGTFNASDASPWVGLRPATPTGIPIIGRSASIANLHFNTGHGALGWTLACGSAELLAQQVSHLPTSIDDRAFRFNSTRGFSLGGNRLDYATNSVSTH